MIGPLKRQSPSRARSRAVLPALLVLTATLSGCSSLSWPAWPSWFSSTDKKIQPLPAITGSASVSAAWQSSLGGKQISSLMPAVADGRVYAAHPTGAIVVTDEKTGAVVGRFQLPAGKGNIAGGVAASSKMVVVGTSKAEVVAFDLNGAVLWSSRLSSEIIAPAAIADNGVFVVGGDGNITALDSATGTRKWSIQRQLPALTVRASAIPVTARGALFVGTPQGKLLAIDGANGAIGWETTVATPKGTSELERLVDVVGRPAVDVDRVCAATYQGRVACFDLIRGNLLWSRDLSTLTGPLIDNRYVYVTDEKGVAQAFDRTTGGTVWKQDVLAGRRATGVALVASYLAIQDAEGTVHLVERGTGKIAGRGLGETFASDVGMVPSGDGALIQTRSGVVAAITAR